MLFPFQCDVFDGKSNVFDNVLQNAKHRANDVNRPPPLGQGRGRGTQSRLQTTPGGIDFTQAVRGAQLRGAIPKPTDLTPFPESWAEKKT